MPESGEIPFGEADGKGKCPELGAAHEKGPADDEVMPEEARLPRKRSSEGPGSPPPRGGKERAQGAKGKVGEGSHVSGGGAVAPKEAGAGESGNGRHKSLSISTSSSHL